MNLKEKDKDKKFKKKSLIVTLSILLVLFLTIGGFYLYVRYSIYEASKTKALPLDTAQEEKKEEPIIPYEEQKGITNILLIGTDARIKDEASRSDSMIIATIDDNTKKIKLTSFIRDTYVDIKGHGKQKINAAFAFGGPELLMDTIERNFRIKLDKYAIIDFWGFEGLVDTIDGLDIDVKDYEIKEINKYIGESTKKTSPDLTHAGIQHLDGQQSLSYARIRQVGNGIYERDSRQRHVISLILDKLKDTSVLKYPEVLSKLLTCVKTNVEPATLLNYGFTASKFKPLVVDQLQMPMSELSDGRIYKGTWVLLTDKDQNSKILSDFIFNDKKPNLNNLDYSSFKAVINSYLSEEQKEKPALNQNDPSLKVEPKESDHSYP